MSSGGGFSLFSCCSKENDDVVTLRPAAARDPAMDLRMLQQEASVRALIAECEKGLAVVPSAHWREWQSKGDVGGLGESGAVRLADFFRTAQGKTSPNDASKVGATSPHRTGKQASGRSTKRTERAVNSRNSRNSISDEELSATSITSVMSVSSNHGRNTGIGASNNNNNNNNTNNSSRIPSFLPAPPSLRPGASVLFGNVRSLDLYSLTLKDSGAIAVASAIQDNHSVKTLSLSSNQISGDGMKAVMNALCKNVDLQNLTILDNAIGSIGVAAIARCAPLMKSLRSLEFGRSLSESFYVPRKGNDVVEASRKHGNSGHHGIVEDSPTVCTQLNEEAVKAMASLLAIRTETLERVCYVGAGEDFTLETMEHVFSAYERAICGNSFGAPSGTSGIPSPPRTAAASKGGLRHITLSRCFTAPFMGDSENVNSGSGVIMEECTKVFSPLSRALAHRSCPLESLNLHFLLGDGGAVALSEGIKETRSLTSIRLAGCGISITGMHAIGCAIAANKSIRLLDISNQHRCPYLPAHRTTDVVNACSALMSSPATMQSGASGAEVQTTPLVAAHQQRRFSRATLGRLPSAHPHRMRGSRQVGDRDSFLRMTTMLQTDDILEDITETSVFSTANRRDSVNPLSTLLAALQENRTLVELDLMGIRVTNDDVENMCAAIEQYNNTSIAIIHLTPIGSNALMLKLENLLLENAHTMACATPPTPTLSQSGTGVQNCNTFPEYKPNGSLAGSAGFLLASPKDNDSLDMSLYSVNRQRSTTGENYNGMPKPIPINRQLCDHANNLSNALPSLSGTRTGGDPLGKTGGQCRYMAGLTGPSGFLSISSSALNAVPLDEEDEQLEVIRGAVIPENRRAVRKEKIAVEAMPTQRSAFNKRTPTKMTSLPTLAQRGSQSATVSDGTSASNASPRLANPVSNPANMPLLPSCTQSTFRMSEHGESEVEMSDCGSIPSSRCAVVTRKSGKLFAENDSNTNSTQVRRKNDSPATNVVDVKRKRLPESPLWSPSSRDVPELGESSNISTARNNAQPDMAESYTAADNLTNSAVGETATQDTTVTSRLMSYLPRLRGRLLGGE